jgi:alpha-mannosidase
MVVSHTHWDREWYQPFEAFRARLVRMMDALIDLLERDPEFKHFVMDGQTVPLDDYLEIRPDRRGTVERLVREGRLLAGPNYMLPDEFLIGGEAWVRNLQFGIRSARRYGAVMNVGYSPDAFGHIAHLPTILRGFGLDAVVIWRGVPNAIEISEFRWAAPDGSEVMVAHLPHGYGVMPNVPEDRQALQNWLNNVRGALEPYATTSHVLVPNGTDHLPAHTGLSGVIRTANDLLPDGRMVHGTYREYVEAVRAELGGRYRDLPLVTGEFRSSDRSQVLAGVLSARMWLKQRYAYCEDLLARYAEPLVAWAHLLRRGERKNVERSISDRAMLRHAWKLLLQNGPHDSVTGCSVDPVYDDVKMRFDRCEQIASAVMFEAHRQIAGDVARPGEETIVVYNSENGPRTDVCTVQMPVERGKLPQKFVNAAGNEAPAQVIQRGIHSPRDSRERVVAAFMAGDVPGFGYKAFRVEHGEDKPAPASREGRSIENEVFRLTAAEDGTLTVEDKRSGRVLRGLNSFVDSGDCGDEYTYCPPDADVTVASSSGPVAVEVAERGPVRWTLEMGMTYSLPKRLTGDRTSRSTERVDCEIVSRVRLYPGVARIEIETEVDNLAEDHRLRVLFPSGIVTAESASEQHFGVVRRAAAAPPKQPGSPETPVATYPQKTFTDLSDGAHGLMIANRGLPEYEVLIEEDGNAKFALTLLRCVGWLSRDDLKTRVAHAGPGFETPGAQVPGQWKFEYALIPHDGGWETAFTKAHRFARPLRAIRVASGSGALPAERLLLSIDQPGVVMSSVKLAEDDDGVVVRLYNIADEPVEAHVTRHEAYGDTRVTDLNEENSRPATLEDAAVQLALKTNEIATLKFGA